LQESGGGGGKRTGNGGQNTNAVSKKENLKILGDETALFNQGESGPISFLNEANGQRDGTRNLAKKPNTWKEVDRQSKSPNFAIETSKKSVPKTKRGGGGGKRGRRRTAESEGIGQGGKNHFLVANKVRGEQAMHKRVYCQTKNK